MKKVFILLRRDFDKAILTWSDYSVHSVYATYDDADKVCQFFRLRADSCGDDTVDYCVEKFSVI